MAVTHEVKVKQNQYKNQLALDEKLKDIKKSIDNRKAANEDILEILSDFVAAYPEMRFMQILSVLGLSFDESNDKFYEESNDKFYEESNDKFYEESDKTLEKVNEMYMILTRK